MTFVAYRVFSSVDYAAQCTCGYGVCRSAEDSFKFLKRVQNLNLGLGNVFFYFFIAKIEDKLNFFFSAQLKPKFCLFWAGA